jgi:hypothetical protein
VLSLLYVMGSGLALFLAGANVAFLFNLGRNLTGWFTLKIVAITGVLAYMALSLYVGQPGVWRASLGVVALMIDLFALGYMWYGIEKLRAEGITGMIPIAKLGDDK